MEYKILASIKQPVIKDFQDVINEYADNGWKLINIISVEFSNSLVAYMERDNA